MSTILFCKSKDGVLLASDGRVIGYTTILSEKNNKIIELDDYYVGSVGLLSLILKIERSVLRGFNGTPIEMIYNIQESLSKEEGKEEVAFLIFSKKNRKFYYADAHVYFPIDRSFYAIGSGRPYALGYLEAVHSQNLSLKEMEKIIKEAMKAAERYDAGTGGEIKIISYV